MLYFVFKKFFTMSSLRHAPASRNAPSLLYQLPYFTQSVLGAVLHSTGPFLSKSQEDTTLISTSLK